MKASEVTEVLDWLGVISRQLEAGYTVSYPAWLWGLVEQVGVKYNPPPPVLRSGESFDLYGSVSPPKRVPYVKLRGGTEIEL